MNCNVELSSNSSDDMKEEEKSSFAFQSKPSGPDAVYRYPLLINQADLEQTANFKKSCCAIIVFARSKTYFIIFRLSGHVPKNCLNAKCLKLIKSD